MTSKSRKRNDVTYEKKAHCLKLVDDGLKPSAIASIMDVSRTTIYNWRKEEAEIKNFTKLNNKNIYRKRNRKSQFPKIEEVLVKWIQLARIWKLPVTGPLIKSMAQSIAQKNNIPTFRASNGWLEKFIKRNTLISLKLLGEGASSKADEHFERFEEIKEICL